MASVLFDELRKHSGSAARSTKLVDALADMGFASDPTAFIDNAGLLVDVMSEHSTASALLASCFLCMVSAGRDGIDIAEQTCWRMALYDACVLKHIIDALTSAEVRGFEGVPRLGSAALAFVLDKERVGVPGRKDATRLRRRLRESALNHGVLNALHDTICVASGATKTNSAAAGRCAETFAYACTALERAVAVSGDEHEVGKDMEHEELRASLQGQADDAAALEAVVAGLEIHAAVRPPQSFACPNPQPPRNTQPLTLTRNPNRKLNQ
jgi:hypothetical protein